MLKLEHLFENFDLARESLTYYPHDASRLEESLGWFRISSNAVYPFWRGERLSFLRLCPAEEKSLAAVEAEIEFIRYLRVKGYPAMEPMAMLSGGYLKTIDTRWGSYQMSAFYCVPGRPVEDLPLKEESVYAYGKALGQLHRLSMDYEPQKQRADYLETAEAFRTELPERLQPVLDRVLDALHQIGRTRKNYGLVHYDFEADNVFYDGQTGTVSVIDFDDSLYHYYAIDLVQALDSLGELVPQEDFPAVYARFLAGYRSEKALSAEQEAAFPLMRKYVQLRSCARICHCLDSEPPMRPDWLIGLEEKLRAKRAWLESILLDS